MTVWFVFRCLRHVALKHRKVLEGTWTLILLLILWSPFFIAGLRLGLEMLVRWSSNLLQYHPCHMTYCTVSFVSVVSSCLQHTSLWHSLWNWSRVVLSQCFYAGLVQIQQKGSIEVEYWKHMSVCIRYSGSVQLLILDVSFEFVTPVKYLWHVASAEMFCPTCLHSRQLRFLVCVHI